MIKVKIAAEFTFSGEQLPPIEVGEIESFIREALKAGAISTEPKILGVKIRSIKTEKFKLKILKRGARDR